MRRILFFLILLLAGLPVISGLYERHAAAQAKRRHTPPGKRVYIRAQALHIVVKGEAHPGTTVILESGAGGCSLEWYDVQAQIAQFARVVAYDRAGRGWSDAGMLPRLPQRIAADLHLLLQAAGIQPPYVLVGQSLGGLYVRQFAAMYPQEVAGLVLIDASHPEMHRYPELGIQGMPSKLAVEALKARLGWKRLRGVRPQGFYATLPADLQRAWADLEPGSTDATVSEILAVMNGVYLPRDLGHLPLAVLTRTPANSPLSPVWQQLQADLAALSTHSTHIIAPKAGHNIHHDDPALVVTTIQQMLQGIQQKSNGAVYF